MANTVVTGTTNAVKVSFNDDPNKNPDIDKATFAKIDIKYMELKSNHVEVVAGDAARWICSHETNTIRALKIDTVNGAAPTSLSDLYDKLSALIE